MRQSGLAQFGIKSTASAQKKSQVQASSQQSADQGKKSPAKSKEKASKTEVKKATPSRSTTPNKKPQSKVLAMKESNPEKQSPMASQRSSRSQTKKEETKKPAISPKKQPIQPSKPAKTASPVKDVEMKSQESDNEEEIGVRRRGRRNTRQITVEESDDEPIAEDVTPSKLVGKKRTRGQMTKQLQSQESQHQDEPEEAQEVQSKRNKVDASQSSQQSGRQRFSSSRRLQNKIEPKSSLELNNGGGDSGKPTAGASTLDLGGGSKTNGTKAYQTGAGSTLDLGGQSNLDLGNSKSGKAASTLDLGGGSNDQKPQNTRSSRRGAGKMAIDEQASDKENDDDDDVEEKPQVLDGLTIVVSGVFNEVTREKIEELVSMYGGRVTGSVSGKTDYLIVGYKLEDGREVTQGGKYRNATAKKKPILDEAGFQDLMRQKLGDEDFTLAAKLPDMAESPLKNGAQQNKTPIDMEKTKNDMWTDRYKPRGFQDLVGNQGAISQLYEWLKDWDEVCIRGNKKPMPIRRGMSWSDVQNVNARAALISGPPGIGKTSAARIVCMQLGYEVVEQNASDVRNKGAIEHAIKDLSHNKTLDYFSVSGVKKAENNENALAAAIGGLASQKSVIIMDEVDGVGAGDRGGIAALIKVIKSCKTPIICICNDRQSQKLASLVNHCFDIKFQRPQSNQITNLVMKVAKSENIDIDKETCANLIESSGQDIRQVINILQMWTQQAATASQADSKKFLAATRKDEKVMINNFEAAYRLLNNGAVPLETKYPRFQQKLDLFFIDHDWVPLLVQESYLNSMGQRQELDDIEAMAQAAEFISLGDSINRQIRTNMQWGLLPQLGTCGAVAPVLLVKGKSLYPRFPEWLGKNSSQRKSVRQIRELKFAMGQQAQANKRAVQLEYVPLVLSMLYKLMVKGDADGAIQVLDDFRLTNDLFKEHLLDLCMNRKAREAFDKLSTQQKTAFTRAYNKEHKDPTVGKRGKKSIAIEDVVSESDDEKDNGVLMDEDEMAELKRAKQRERERIKAQNESKIDKFEMINPVVKGEEGGKKAATGKAKGAAAKKGKAKTQKAGKGGKNSEDDSLDGFVVDDDDEDAVKPRGKGAKKGAKAKTAKGKK